MLHMGKTWSLELHKYFSLFHLLIPRRISGTALLVLRANAAARTNGLVEMRSDRQPTTAIRVDVGRICGKFLETVIFICKQIF